MTRDNDKYPGVPRVVDHVLANEDPSLDSLSKAHLIRQEVTLNRVVENASYDGHLMFKQLNP